MTITVDPTRINLPYRSIYTTDDRIISIDSSVRTLAVYDKDGTEIATSVPLITDWSGSYIINTGYVSDDGDGFTVYLTAGERFAQERRFYSYDDDGTLLDQGLFEAPDYLVARVDFRAYREGLSLDNGNVALARVEHTTGADARAELSIYEPGGTLVGASLWRHTDSSGSPSTTNTQIALAQSGDSIFWFHQNSAISLSDRRSEEVYLTVLNTDGEIIRDEVQVTEGNHQFISLSRTDSQGAIDAATLKNGNVVVTYASAKFTGKASDATQDGDIWYTIYRPDGTVMQRESRVNTADREGQQGQPQIFALDDGGFVIEWEEMDNDAVTVGMQRFEALGNPFGPNVFPTDPFQPGSASVIFEDGTGFVNGFGGAFAVTVDLEQDPRPSTRATARDDDLIGAQERDVIKLKAGEDRFVARKGNDRVEGGNGDDTIFGGNGRDKLFGGQGRDTLNGQRGDDFLNGGAENDRLNGGAGNDTLNGSTGDDLLFGRAGRDTLIYTGGDDTLVGGAGADRFDFTRTNGEIGTIRDFRANDRLVFDAEFETSIGFRAVPGGLKVEFVGLGGPDAFLEGVSLGDFQINIDFV